MLFIRIPDKISVIICDDEIVTNPLVSTCIFTWFSEPLNHKRRFSTILYTLKRPKENRGHEHLLAQVSSETFLTQKWTNHSANCTIFRPFLKRIFDKRFQKSETGTKEVVLFWSFLRICHCAKLMERLGLALLYVERSIFRAPCHSSSAYYSLLPLLLFFCFSWRTATGIFFLFFFFFKRRKAEKKMKNEFPSQQKSPTLILGLLAQIDETHVAFALEH